MTPAEIDRAEAHRSAVMAWADRLPAVLASPDTARALAFAVVGELLRTFVEPRKGSAFALAMGSVCEVYTRAKASADVQDYRTVADRLGSLLLPRAAPAWTWETRAPYEVCEALRRACEAERILCYGPPPWAPRCASCSCGRLVSGAPCDVCGGTEAVPCEPASPPVLATLLHDAHALLSDLRADTAGLEQLVADAEAREREKPTARPCRAETTTRIREGWER